MKGITDGKVSADLANWTDSQDASLALTHNSSGKPLCPICADAGYVEILYLSTISKRYSCTRKHLFASA